LVGWKGRNVSHCAKKTRRAVRLLSVFKMKMEGRQVRNPFYFEFISKLIHNGHNGTKIYVYSIVVNGI